MDEAARLVAEYACRIGKKLIITPPALVYDTTLLSKWTNILSSHLSTRWVDLNYHFDLSRMDDYSCHMERNARKNLNRALRQDFSFVKLDSGKRSDVERAYNIIRRNREERGTHYISIPNCRLHTEVCSPSIPDSGMASWKGADLLVQGVCL